MEKADNKNFTGKSKKFNIIDFILIIFIAAAVLILVYIMLGNNLFSRGEDVTILYSIQVDLIKDELVYSIEDRLMPGTKILDSVRNEEIGEVYHVKREPALEYTDDKETGVVRRVPFPDHSKVIITVKAQSKKEKVKYMVNGKAIMVGIPIHFRTPELVSVGNCIYLEELKENSDD